jgi:hypothetical protein
VEAQGAWALAASLYRHLSPVRVQRLGLGKEQRHAEGRVGMAPAANVVRERLHFLRSYRWSSYGRMRGIGALPAWLTCEALLARARRGDLEGKRSYRQWIEKQSDVGAPADSCGWGALS